MPSPLEHLPEQPLYTLHQDKKRALIPKIISLLSLSLIFYLGVLVNLSFLELTSSQETALKITALLLLVLILASGFYLAFRRAGQPFLFYRDRLHLHGKEIPYIDIINTAPHQDLLDKLFRTYSLNLGSGFHLRHVPLSLPVENYLQQRREYAQRVSSVPPYFSSNK